MRWWAVRPTQKVDGGGVVGESKTGCRTSRGWGRIRRRTDGVGEATECKSRRSDIGGTLPLVLPLPHCYSRRGGLK